MITTCTYNQDTLSFEIKDFLLHLQVLQKPNFNRLVVRLLIYDHNVSVLITELIT